MNIKNLTVAICDVLAYIVLALLVVTVGILLMQGATKPAATIALVGVPVYSLFFGFWFILSAMLDELKKLNNKEKS